VALLRQQALVLKPLLAAVAEQPQHLLVLVPPATVEALAISISALPVALEALVSLAPLMPF